ncbi:hypothetical protein IAT38_001660 [Cryptococcus sp. DSM 104549]
MAKHHRNADEALPVDDYELQASSGASDPLLPSYDEHKPFGHSPYQRLEGHRRASRFRRALGGFCVALLIIVPLLGLVTCYFGKTTLDKVRSWDQLPPDVKEWIDQVVPASAHADHSAFPTDVGYAGPTPTGKEPALIATAPALPLYSNVHPLIKPTEQASKSFSIIQHWGNLSPFYSVDSHGLPETSQLIPEQCELDQLHWLQRHGARYPTSYPAGPGAFASRLKDRTGWKTKGALSFLNNWDYKLGAEILTPFGRSQLFNLGVHARVKYGYLLDKMKGRLPVFRTESQDRMLRSAQNFATGFFGFPADDQYNLEVTIEAPGFNNTLAPYTTCRGSGVDYRLKLAEWDAVYLKEAKERLQALVQGWDLTFTDINDMMEMCAYETVSLGYSSFCDLFTQKEWKGFQYRNDLYWWYSSSFGYAPAKAMGMGWVQELVSRLSKTRLTEFNSTTNSSFHNDVHFPLDDPLYVDFTHDTQFALLLPTMNLTTFAESGDLPTDHIPKHRSFISSKIMPFATNLQLQVLTCSGEKEVRLILNDAAVPLTGINGCPEDDDGLCPLNAFISSMQTLIGEVDFAKECSLEKGVVEQHEEAGAEELAEMKVDGVDAAGVETVSENDDEEGTERA